MNLSNKKLKQIKELNSELFNNIEEIIALLKAAIYIEQCCLELCCLGEITIKYLKIISNKISKCEKRISSEIISQRKIKQMKRLYNSSYGDLCYIKAFYQYYIKIHHQIIRTIVY